LDCLRLLLANERIPNKTVQKVGESVLNFEK
jgi:hypothetical protein